MKGYGLGGLRWTWRKKNLKALLVGLVTEVNREVRQELVRQHRRQEKRHGGAAGDGGGAPYSSFRSPVAGSCLPRSDNRRAGAWHAAGDACHRHARGGRRGDRFSGEDDARETRQAAVPGGPVDAAGRRGSEPWEGPKMFVFLVELRNMMKEYMARLETED
ncbi:hypothetical protein TRIUR3_31163 [Triticum urartu]|uniref:Uncharacterized protein n=1 Tax=Triticum urartu TaxID=4572 RepID=M7ZI59_TRIUA|nr:hypothetical protein TRIUR3_31163 [Triticum urartu]